MKRFVKGKVRGYVEEIPFGVLVIIVVPMRARIDPRLLVWGN